MITTGTINLNNVLVNSGSGTVNTMKLSSSGLEIYNTGGTRTVFLTPSGTAEFSGKITASSGNIGGFSITNSDYLQYGTMKIYGGSSSASQSDGTYFDGIIDLSRAAAFGSFYAGGGGITTSGPITSTKLINIVHTTGTSYITKLQIGDRIDIVGGYGVISDWSPFTNATTTTGVDLGQSTQRWRRVYAANTTISSSDARLKTDIEDAIGLDFINKLRPVKYKFINGDFEPVLDEEGNEVYEGINSKGYPMVKTIGRPGVRKHWGLIAQEVKQAMDEVGIDDFAGWVKDDLSDPDSMQSLSYEQFISPIVKSIQELSTQVQSISQRLDALEA